MNILENLTSKQKSLIQTKKYTKDNILFHENDFCDCIGIIISGQINIVTYLEDGNEIIYNSLDSNDIFGNNLIFSSNPYYKGDIIAKNDCEIAYISKINLLQILKNNTSFLLDYLKIQSNFTKDLNNRIKLLSISSAEERLCFYLHQNNNKIEYVTISDLAKQLYLKRETLSRLISKLQKSNKIIKNGNLILLNK